ncbi:MAG: YitT family protein [Chloroflexi bacterium]|nr:YitT family protein [Chloroflexota bacterium]
MSKRTPSPTRRFRLRFSWRNFFFLTIGSLLLAVNVDLFLSPARIAPGGVSGTAIIIHAFTDWPIGLLMLALNIPMLIVGFWHLGRFNFLFRTLYVVVLYSIGVDVLARWIPPRGITDDLLLNALYAGILGGIGTGLVYRGRGTSGGTGVLGRVLQLKTGIPISQVYLLTDGGVVLIAGLVFGWDRALYAMMTLFIWGMAADQILEGPSVVRTVFIITDQPESVTGAVFEHLGLGVTAWPARGMFTESEHTVLFCTINRPDVNALREVVINRDPNAFVVIGHGHQTIGGVLPRQARSVELPARDAMTEFTEKAHE